MVLGKNKKEIDGYSDYLKGCYTMCTGIFTKTKDGTYLLSRTMDFALPLEPSPLFIPRDFAWQTAIEQKSFKTTFGFIGAGRLLGETYFVADGVNEKGLSVAELYLPGEVYYAEQPTSSKVNVAPHELILWLLGTCATIDDVEAQLSNLRLVSARIPELDIVTPLHWILTDVTGRCVVIEPTEETLVIKDNAVGVMTNTPCLEWHIENLRNYLHVRPQQCESVRFGDYIAKPFSQGTGTSGLPGGFTPPERFVRVAFFKEHIEEAENEAQGVYNNNHILSTVRIPKGIVITANETSDYSQYVGTMCNNSKTYYYSAYDQHDIVKVTLTEQLLAHTSPKQFQLDTKFKIHSIQ